MLFHFTRIQKAGRVGLRAVTCGQVNFRQGSQLGCV